MAREPPSDGGSESGEGATGDGRLVALYERYVGEPESEQVVYVGFGLFFAGIALGLAGLVLFLYSGVQPTGSDFFWRLRTVALVFALLAMPAAALSIVVLLGVGRRTLAASAAGTLLCVAATAWLTSVYPYQWTSAGNDIRVIASYAVGLVLLAASTGSALVAQYVEEAAPRERDREPVEDETGSVSDEEVAEDIEEAMSDSTLTWGGVEKGTETKRLKFDMPETEGEVDRAEVTASETRASGETVDSAVSDLRTLQGGDRETARSESPDAQVDSLSELRRRQEREDVETGVDTDRGLLARLRRKLFG
jgi:hypothetical protein